MRHYLRAVTKAVAVLSVLLVAIVSLDSRVYSPPAEAEQSAANKETITPPDKPMYMLSSEELIKLLDSADPVIKADATRYLGMKNATKVIPELIKVLGDHTSFSSGALSSTQILSYSYETSPAKEAALALANIGRPALDPLLEALKSGTPDIKEGAAPALGLLIRKGKGPFALDMLSINHDDRQKRPSGITEDEIIKPLISALSDRDAKVRTAAAQGLGITDSLRTVTPLLKALQDKDGVVRAAAIRALSVLEDPRSHAPTLAALEDKDAEVRAEAARALMGKKDKGPIKPLIHILKSDPDPRPRRFAASALARTDDPAVTQTLIGSLKDRDAEVRENAVRALYWNKQTRVVSAIRARLSDNDPRVRATAVNYFQKQPKLWPEVLPLLEDKDSDVRYMTASVLGESGNRGAVEPLLRALSDDNSRVRIAAIVALGQLKDARAVEPLLAIFLGNDESTRMHALRALGSIGDSRAITPIIDFLDQTHPDMFDAEKESTISALKGLDRQIVENRLIEGLNSKNWSTRANFADALGVIGTRKAVEALLPLLNDENDVVRWKTRDALTKLTGARPGDSSADWQKWWDQHKESELPVK